MINGKTVLAVIPARGGSKRVPMKNVTFYKGKPLIEWAIDSARQSKYIDHFCVSSDDYNIIGIAESCGATALPRPAWLATDHAMNEGVLVHTLYTWKWADWVVLLQPTSPLRTGEDIDTCIERAQGHPGCVSFNEYGRRNGAVYVADSQQLVASIAFDRDVERIFYIMPNTRSLDIDYASDFNS